jgi:hypothetical protein
MSVNLEKPPLGIVPFPPEPVPVPLPVLWTTLSPPPPLLQAIEMAARAVKVIAMKSIENLYMITPIFL